MPAGGDRFFVDTNVLLYCLDSRAPEKQSLAAAWCDALWRRDAARLSWQVLNEFYSNAIRRIGTPAGVARAAIETYLAWRPVDFTGDLLRRAWHWTDRGGVSYWDGLILASAERSGSQWLLSEDFQAGRKYGAVTVVNPFETAPDGFFADEPPAHR